MLGFFFCWRTCFILVILHMSVTCFSSVQIMTCYILTHWGWVTHICVSKLAIIGSHNGLLPGRRKRHYLNQFWNIVNWTLRNKLQWNHNQHLCVVFAVFDKIKRKKPKKHWLFVMWSCSYLKGLQQSCSDSCQIWTWFKESKRYFDNLKITLVEKSANKVLVSPIPGFGRVELQANTPSHSEVVQFLCSMHVYGNVRISHFFVVCCCAVCVCVCIEHKFFIIEIKPQCEFCSSNVIMILIKKNMSVYFRYIAMNF